MFLFSFLALTVYCTHPTELFATDRETNQKRKCFGYVIHAWCMNALAKEKIVHSRGPSKTNFGVFIWYF